MKRRFLLIPIVALVGCDKGEYVPVPRKVPPKLTELGDGKDLMPLKEGTIWTYVVESEFRQQGKPPKQESSTLLFSINKVTETPTGLKATLEVTKDDKPTDKQTWIVNDKGIYQSAIGLTPVAYDPPQLILPFPVKVGEKFTWKGKGMCANGSVGQIITQNVVQDSQPVDTALGVDDAAVSQAFGVFSQGAFQSAKGPGRVEATTYFKPGTGIVRLVQRVLIPQGLVTTTLKLQKVEVVN